MHPYFRSEKVTEHTTAIHTGSHEIMYLICGAEKAILVDTSVGIRGLGEFVKELTDLPLTVLLTHGHIDHAMGAQEFDTVYMNHADTGVYLGMREPADRLGYIRQSGGDADIADLLPPVPMTFRDLQDGMVFDLGGIHVDVLALPGHTPGSMTMLIREERSLILGDACNLFTFVFDENSLPLEQYRESLRQYLTRVEGKYDDVYLCHGVIRVGKDIIQNVIDVCTDVLEGRSDEELFTFMGTSAMVAKARTPFGARLDGIEGNIVYNPKRLK